MIWATQAVVFINQNFILAAVHLRNEEVCLAKQEEKDLFNSWYVLKQCFIVRNQLTIAPC